jgi:hypothetical protein
MRRLRSEDHLLGALRAQFQQPPQVRLVLRDVLFDIAGVEAWVPSSRQAAALVAHSSAGG